jgi:hypothetical protein
MLGVREARLLPPPMDGREQTQIRDLALRVVAVSLNGHGESDTAATLAKLFKRLHDVVAPMVGELGFGAVIKRAVWLAARTANAAGFPAETGLDQSDLVPLIERAGPQRTLRWAEEIVDQTLALLHSFLGEKLTLRLAERAFPLAFRRAAAEAFKGNKEGPVK